MTRLIDADALKEWLQILPNASYTDMVLNTIDDLPTIDAEPVRHGKWDKGTDSCWHICEECGAEVDISMGTGVWVEGVELCELKYCPNCGAREISKGRMKILAMDFPYRKKKGLGIYDYHSNAYVKVATFNNEESAECFMEYLAKFVGARMDEDD